MIVYTVLFTTDASSVEVELITKRLMQLLIITLIKPLIYWSRM